MSAFYRAPFIPTWPLQSSGYYDSNFHDYPTITIVKGSLLMATREHLPNCVCLQAVFSLMFYYFPTRFVFHQIPWCFLMRCFGRLRVWFILILLQRLLLEIRMGKCVLFIKQYGFTCKLASVCASEGPCPSCEVEMPLDKEKVNGSCASYENSHLLIRPDLTANASLLTPWLSSLPWIWF